MNPIDIRTKVLNVNTLVTIKMASSFFLMIDETGSENIAK